MEFKKKPQSSVPVVQLSKVVTQAARVQPVDLLVQRHAELRRDLQTHTSRPATLQRQVVQPALRAAELHTQEAQRLAVQRETLQREAAELGPVAPEVMAQALQRQQAPKPQAPTKPQSVGDWVTVMRLQAEQAQGRRMNSREVMQYNTLQRQVANTIAQGFRQDQQPASARHQQYGQHLATLQRSAAAPVATLALQLMPTGERPAVQRAVDEVLQREAEQQAQEQVALKLHTLQRQLAELDQQATQPVLERIQQRRGAGNPLPQAIQRHLEQGLNHDLSAVRIHDDAEADKLAKKVNAVAFTTGQDIYFRAGKYNPNSQSGLELLAHEVTHTVQQARGEVGPGLDPSTSHETQAREMGRKLAQKPIGVKGKAAKLPARSAPLTLSHAVQRQQTPKTPIPPNVLKNLGNAIQAGDLEKSLKILRQLSKANQAKALGEMLKQFKSTLPADVLEGLQAMLDGLNRKIPEAIKKVARKPVNPGPWNPPGKQKPFFYIGTSAHNAIAAYYAAFHSTDLLFTNTIPMSQILKGASGLSKLAKNEIKLKPDIVNMTKRHLYEIKPRGQAGVAIAEANMYLKLFQKANVPMNLGPVDDPGVIGVVQAPGGYYTFQAIVPGAIVYDYRKGQYVPEPLPVTVQEPAPAKKPTTSPVTTMPPLALPTPVPRGTGNNPNSAPSLPGGGLPSGNWLDDWKVKLGISSTAGVILYLLISEGTRVIPARNLIPVL